MGNTKSSSKISESAEYLPTPNPVPTPSLLPVTLSRYVEVPSDAAEHTFFFLTSENQSAFRVATFSLNVDAFDDASREATEHFVTWDALGEVADFLPDSLIKYYIQYQRKVSGRSLVDSFRLECVLEFCDICANVFDDKETAVRVAKIAFDEAISELDLVDEIEYKKVCGQVEILRDLFSRGHGDL